MTDHEAETILRGVLCSGIDRPGSPAWRMKSDWLWHRRELTLERYAVHSAHAAGWLYRGEVWTKCKCKWCR